MFRAVTRSVSDERSPVPTALGLSLDELKDGESDKKTGGARCAELYPRLSIPWTLCSRGVRDVSLSCSLADVVFSPKLRMRHRRQAIIKTRLLDSQLVHKLVTSLIDFR